MAKKKGSKKKNKNITKQNAKKRTKHVSKKPVVWYLYTGIHPWLQNQFNLQTANYVDLNTGNSGLQFFNEQVKTEYSSPPVIYNPPHPTPKIDFLPAPLRYKVVFMKNIYFYPYFHKFSFS